jgi:hypothetical protein
VVTAELVGPDGVTTLDVSRYTMAMLAELIIALSAHEVELRLTPLR